MASSWIWALKLSDIMLGKEGEEKVLTQEELIESEDISPEAAIEATMEELVNPDAVSEEVVTNEEDATEEEEVIETIPDSIQQEKIDALLAERKAEMEEIAKKQISPEAYAELENNIMPAFYEKMDRETAELNRYMKARQIASEKLDAALEQIEEYKYQLKRTADIDDDVRYLSRLKKENADDYADTLIEETAKQLGIPGHDLRKMAKADRRSVLEGFQEWTDGVVVNNSDSEEPQKKPLFEGYKIK